MQRVDVASEHWMALDRVFRRLFGGAAMAHARTRMAHRAAVLSDVHMRRLMRFSTPDTPNRGDLRRQLLHLQQTHRALTAALAAATSADDQSETP